MVIKADTTLFLDSLAFNCGNDVHADGLDNFKDGPETVHKNRLKENMEAFIYRSIWFYDLAQKRFSSLLIIIRTLEM